MKLFLGAFLALAATASAQGPTVTDGLLAGQADLEVSQKFFEETIYRSRIRVSSYVYRINREIIDSHINTYAVVKNLGLDTLAAIEDFDADDDQRECLDKVLDRWNLQKLR